MYQDTKNTVKAHNGFAFCVFFRFYMKRRDSNFHACSKAGFEWNGAAGFPSLLLLGGRPAIGPPLDSGDSSRAFGCSSAMSCPTWWSSMAAPTESPHTFTVVRQRSLSKKKLVLICGRKFKYISLLWDQK